MTIRNDASEKLNDKSIQSYFFFLRIVVVFNLVLFLFRKPIEIFIFRRVIPLFIFYHVSKSTTTISLLFIHIYLYWATIQFVDSFQYAVFCGCISCWVCKRSKLGTNFFARPVYYIAASSEMLDKEPLEHVSALGNTNKTSDAFRIMFIYIPGMVGLLACLNLNVTFVLPFVTHHYIKDPTQ